ncbi:uncharacterized protein LOC117609853 [Osmia lignaria lignaria]|uniref:uncharacterized protein LOC117609853 n=1 Tax=Osmia lignaria lignaria TaxID=1437193 RepID=UPI00402B76C9
MFREINNGFWNGMNADEVVEVYTDGSKKRGMDAVGSRMVVRGTNSEWEDFGWFLNKATSVFSAEAYAILQALRYVNDKPKNRKFLIITDSASVLEKVAHVGKNQGDCPWCFEIVRKLRKNALWNDREDVNAMNVAFAWVPSHVGIEGNERADLQARLATRGEEELGVGVSIRDIRLYLSEGAWERFINRMTTIGMSKGAKYFSNPKNNVGNKKPWFFKVTGVDREVLTRMSRLRANHFNLGESLFRKNLIESKECSCGYGEESIGHVVWDCEKFLMDRLDLNLYLEERGFSPGSDVLDIFMSGNLGVCKRISKFLNKLGRII